MQNQLYETLYVVRKLNEHLGSKIINQDEFAEKKQNIDDFIQVRKKLQKLLQELNENIDKGNEQVFAKVVSLSNKYSDFIWHFEQIQKLINKIIRKYPL